MEKCQTRIHMLLVLAKLLSSLSAGYVAASSESEALLTEFVVFSVNTHAGWRRAENLRTIDSLSKDSRKIDKRSIPDAKALQLTSYPSAILDYEESTNSISATNATDSGSARTMDVQKRAIIDLSIVADDEEQSRSIADLKNIQNVLHREIDGYDQEVSYVDAPGKVGSTNTFAASSSNEEDDYIPTLQSSFITEQNIHARLPDRSTNVSVSPRVSNSSRQVTEYEKPSPMWDRDDEIGEIFSSVMHHLHEAESKLKNLSTEADSAEDAQSRSKISAATAASSPPMVSLGEKLLALTDSKLAPISVATNLEKSMLGFNNATRKKNTKRFSHPRFMEKKLSFQHSVRNHNISADITNRSSAGLTANINLSNIDALFRNRTATGDQFAGLEPLQLLDEQGNLSDSVKNIRELDNQTYSRTETDFLLPYHRMPASDQLPKKRFDSYEFPFNYANRLVFLKATSHPEQRSRLQSDNLHVSQEVILSKYYDSKEMEMVERTPGNKLPSSLDIDLEDPGEEPELLRSLNGDVDIGFEPYENERLATSLNSALSRLNPGFKAQNTAPLWPKPLHVDTLVVMKSKDGGDDFPDAAATSQRNSYNPNKIEFFPLANATLDVACMDGSKPGYYMRRGIEGGVAKWIVHLHGGAWCYDLNSCQKRRNTILGSTKNWFKEDIDSFFHGVLSRNYTINPHYFDWNAVVLSYCDGGLFSGTRLKPIFGKGVKYFFRGRRILQAQVDQLREVGLSNATEVILSGTSAGGLALVLQGDFIRSRLPTRAKVRAMVDAGLFLDEESVTGKRLARKQMKALYKLHRPQLNEKCILTYPPKQRYLCLFPEYTIKYVKIPIFFVNSLYDHWQLSELQGVHCAYMGKCETKDMDRILKFRKSMFEQLMRIVKQKNDSGVFANSCLAHGQVILDYTWSHVRIENRTIGDSFNDWYNSSSSDQSNVRTDCRYPCNGSCPRILSQRCVANFKGASELIRRKRNSEMC